MSLPASPALPILPAMLISTQSCMHLMSYVLSCLRPCVHQGTSQMPMGQIVCAKFSCGWLFVMSGCWVQAQAVQSNLQGMAVLSVRQQGKSSC